MSYRNAATATARRWARDADTVRTPRTARARRTARRTATRQAFIAAAIADRI